MCECERGTAEKENFQSVKLTWLDKGCNCASLSWSNCIIITMRVCTFGQRPFSLSQLKGRTEHYMKIHLDQARCQDSRRYITHCAQSSSQTSPWLLPSMAVTQNIHPGNHCEQYGNFISESYGKPQSRNYLCLSAFLLLHDGCLMSTWTCGNT